MTERAPNATISSRTDINDELIVLRVLPDEGLDLSYQPGQYAELGITEGEKFIRRPYSIASAPSLGREIEFFIVKVADGEFTPKLFALNTGDRIWLGPKIKGKFTLDAVPPGKDLITISTGTGLAPFMSMLRENLNSERWNKFVVVNCVRLVRDLGYKDELEQLSTSREDVAYIPMVTREDWQGIRGRVQKLFEENLFEQLAGIKLDPNQSQVLLCGNPEMIESVIAILEGQGFKVHSKKEPGNIHFERYW